MCIRDRVSPDGRRAERSDYSVQRIRHLDLYGWKDIFVRVVDPWWRTHRQRKSFGGFGDDIFEDYPDECLKESKNVCIFLLLLLCCKLYTRYTAPRKAIVEEDV